MSQYMVLNVTESGDWIDQVLPHPWGQRALGLHVPPKFRPSLVHPTREAAEREAAQLACEAGVQEGMFAVFELVGVVRGMRLTDDTHVKGIDASHPMKVPRWDEAPVEI